MPAPAAAAVGATPVTASAAERSTTADEECEAFRLIDDGCGAIDRAAPDSTSWHYWSDTKTNDRGESLEECVRKYGLGSNDIVARTSSSDNVTAVDDNDTSISCVFLDESHTFEHAWLLAVQLTSTGVQD